MDLRGFSKIFSCEAFKMRALKSTLSGADFHGREQ